MIIKCIDNNTSALAHDKFEERLISPDKFPLIKEKTYTVYALAQIEGNIWYSICDESYFLYPMWRPFPLFEIIDNRLSRYWVFAFQEWENKKQLFLSFPEWANDADFYGELVEGNSCDKNAVIFRKYKDLMDLEFPDNSITEIAQVGDKEWLICPICIDAWNCSNDQDGMVKCPKCGKVLQNPRYQNRPNISLESSA